MVFRIACMALASRFISNRYCCCCCSGEGGHTSETAWVVWHSCFAQCAPSKSSVFNVSVISKLLPCFRASGGAGLRRALFLLMFLWHFGISFECFHLKCEYPSHFTELHRVCAVWVGEDYRFAWNNTETTNKNNKKANAECEMQANGTSESVRRVIIIIPEVM